MLLSFRLQISTVCIVVREGLIIYSGSRPHQAPTPKPCMQPMLLGSWLAWVLCEALLPQLMLLQCRSPALGLASLPHHGNQWCCKHTSCACHQHHRSMHYLYHHAKNKEAIKIINLDESVLFLFEFQHESIWTMRMQRELYVFRMCIRIRWCWIKKHIDIHIYVHTFTCVLCICI